VITSGVASLVATINQASGIGLWHIVIMATVIAVAMLILVGKLEQKVPSDNSEPS